jgi:hypothetical protein
MDDPIFALIRAHQTDLMASMGDREEVDPDRALLALLTAQPTTMAGAMALLEHVGQPEHLVDERESILSGVSMAGPELQEAGRLFPTRLAATMLSITEAQS